VTEEQLLGEIVGIAAAKQLKDVVDLTSLTKNYQLSFYVLIFFYLLVFQYGFMGTLR